MEPNKDPNLENNGNVPPSGNTSVNDIAADLGKADSPEHKETDAPQAKEPVMFDLSKLQPEQLQVLKEMLETTPGRVKNKKGNPVTRLRLIKGKMVQDFKDAYEGMTFNPVTQSDMLTLKIPVKFFGEAEFKDIPYSDFMAVNNQVTCEIVGQRTINLDPIVEGEVMQKSEIPGMPGRLVQLEVNRSTHFYTIKVPESIPEVGGKTFEIPAKISNA
jgi:hypothetical protein